MKRINKYGLVLYKQTHIEQKDKGTKVAAKFVDELFCLIAKYLHYFIRMATQYTTLKTCRMTQQNEG
jgi:Mn-dependent DtxR family transcriptional regulator